MSSFLPSRRSLLKLAAAMPALTLPAMGQAQLGGPSASNPAHFRFTLGDAKLTVVSDGYFQLPTSGLGVNAPAEDVQSFLQQHFLSPDMGYSHTNHLVIELGEAVVMVDVGSGARFMPTAGQLMRNMEQAGIDPASITHVVMTHAHPDHIWGVRDDFDEAILPDAAYFLGEAEHVHWSQDGLVDRVAPEMQQFVVGALNSFATEGITWNFLGDTDEVVPGVRVIPTPGHTPGHLSVVVESNGLQLIALGDALTHAYISFARPDWVNGFDMDADQTVASRKRLLDMAAADRMAVLGYHFPFPGVGHVMREGDSYRFVPALWQFE